MLRPLLITATTVVAIWGTALSAAPVGMADPPDVNCTQVNNDARCMYKNCTDAQANGRCTFEWAIRPIARHKISTMTESPASAGR